MKPLNILEVSASGRGSASVSRQLSRDTLAALEDRYGNVNVVRRDLNDGIGFVDEDWIAANFTDPDERSDAQRERLSESDELIAELRAADVIVIGAPMYNFSIPATLKAWIDQVARARVTFRYTNDGPVGLLDNKKAIVIATSGGVPIGSPVDHATPYLRHALGFLGIADVEVIGADQLNAGTDDAMDRARAAIANAIHTTPSRNIAAA